MSIGIKRRTALRVDRPNTNSIVKVKRPLSSKAIPSELLLDPVVPIEVIHVHNVLSTLVFNAKRADFYSDSAL